MLPVFSGLLDDESPSFHVVRARVAQPGLSDALGSKVDVVWTYAAAVAQVLRHHKTGLEPCATRRFRREAGKTNDPDYVLGYTREDWSRAFFITATFMHMRKPKYAADGATGPGSVKTAVAWVRPEEEKAILGEGDVDNSYSNIYFREVVEYCNLVGQTLSLDAQEAAGDDGATADDNHDRRLEALTLRLQYMIGVNPTTSLSSAIQKRRRDRNQPEGDPASVGTIREMVRSLQTKMGEPVVSGHDRDPASIFEQVLGADRMDRFMATQANMAEGLAAQRALQSHDEFEDSRVATINEIKQAFALDQFLSRFSPPETDIRDAIRAAGMDPEDWNNLAINPKHNSTFKLMPHQVVGKSQPTTHPTPPPPPSGGPHRHGPARPSFDANGHQYRARFRPGTSHDRYNVATTFVLPPRLRPTPKASRS